jgi:rSAM/selenodomain-associated transferase 1
VKTRLARDIGTFAAAQWYRQTLARTVAAARTARIDFAICAASSAAVFRSTARPAAPVQDQHRGDLGRRMALAAKQQRGATLIVGSDIPGLAPAILCAAARSAARFDLLIGPARDGGYYLIGLRTPAHAFRLFEKVRWSSPHALADTLANAPKHWRTGFLPMLDDVDCGADLKRAAQPPASALVRMSSSPARS